jgi:hypothetical protein
MKRSLKIVTEDSSKDALELLIQDFEDEVKED